MADQCIVCLENLDVAPPLTPQLPAAIVDGPDSATVAEAAAPAEASSSNNTDQAAAKENNDVARIQVCGHMLHDSCLREWTEKANSCPICRQSFKTVEVFDKAGGELIYLSVLRTHQVANCQ